MGSLIHKQKGVFFFTPSRLIPPRWLIYLSTRYCSFCYR